LRDELGRRLCQLAGKSPTCAEWRPTRFDLAAEDDRTALAALLDSGAVRRVHDTLAEQLGLLVSVRSPAARWAPHELDQHIRHHLDDRSPSHYGAWVWYPWSATLVHLLPRAEFREVRTDRNRHKITRTEQGRLAELRIGVVGLSVGNAAAVTLALEGIGGSFRIADLDRLELSNLNRLRAGVADLGVEKTVLAARQMFEVDPYLDIERFAGGVQPENVDEFLLGGGRLDLLVEECDDLHVKVLVRERARAHGIPVLMETSDRGLLDVERFDLEPDRPIFHGLVDSLRAADVRGLATKEKIPFVLAILDGRRLSARAAASLPEIGHTIGSWPQLASGVALGGALVADAARRLLLGEPVGSGRYYVDPATLVATGAGDHHEPLSAGPTPGTPPEARVELPPEPAEQGAVNEDGAVSEDAVRWIAALGTLAPSAHNAQPWALTWRRASARLECRHDPARDLPSLDFEHGATWVAFGALVENIELAATHLGLRADTRSWPDGDDPSLVCTVAFAAEPRPEPSPLVPHVVSRVTNRARERRRPLGEDVAARLDTVCSEAGARLQLLCDDGALADIGALMGAADRLSLLNRAMHHDVMQGYRWTPEEARATPYGLDLATAELTAAERAVFSLLRQWRVMECLAEIGGGRALEDLSRTAVASASAVGLLTVPGTSRESYLRGGRAMQRMWLTATAGGIAVHPITTLPYLFARLERGTGQGLDAHECAELRQLRARYRTLFDTPADHAEVLLFRLARAGAPSARSLRRPLHEVFQLA
jgi:molybdopterin/thiamine biosynthesis adenylyltransferase/nitroreductase